MANPAEPPPGLRRLGRSREYSPASLPDRLTRWHSPRADRWERLHVGTGRLTIAHLGASTVTMQTLEAGGTCWIGPGMRWRVAHAAPDTRFELDVHAATPAASSAPPRLQADTLAEAERVDVEDARALGRLLRGLAAGDRRLVRGRFDWTGTLRGALEADAGTLSWHPLDVGDGHFTAFAARTGTPIGLVDYLGRDHLVIEAALAGMLCGDADYTVWLRSALERHIRIEETLVFPAYVAGGGREAWVRGLNSEHAHIRRYLETFAEPDVPRKFVRLLDGHDEKEERVVYPDIIAHLGARADGLVPAAMLFPLPFRSIRERELR